MYKTSKETQKHKDAKKQFILDTSAIVFADKGYHNTAVKDIVEKANISVGSFYFYFKGKEELFTELYCNIVKEFQSITESVLDLENGTLSKNFTRVITANLWMYEKNREIAKIMLIEAVGLNPKFEKMRSVINKESNQTMAEWLRRFKVNNPVNIPDERIAALIYEGSFNYVIIDWLQSDQTAPLTDSAYALAIYHLQAIRAPFESEDIKKYINEVLEELNQRDGDHLNGGKSFE